MQMPSMSGTIQRGRLCRGRGIMEDALELLKQQEKIIIKYRKTDAFLAVHGWEWDDD